MIKKNLADRLAQLEGPGDENGDIPIFVDCEEDVAAAIDAAIEAGEISAADRPRCKFWQDAVDWSPGYIARLLKQIDGESRGLPSEALKKQNEKQEGI